MKKAQIIHNPTAGNAAHTREEIIELVKMAGFKTNYVSTDDEAWESFIENEMDVIFLAGGDGTIRKLASVLIEKEMCDRHIPIYLLPLGTANNIATSLEISKKLNSAYTKKEKELQKFTCGKLKGVGDDDFFLEGVGFGVFPELIRKMKEKDQDGETPDEKLNRSLRILLEIVKDYKAQKASIKADGLKIKGRFLLVELMNIKYIGPNLEFAPNANVEDNFLDLVLIPEAKREAFVAYVESLISGNSKFQDIRSFVKVLRVKKLKMKWKGSQLHVDDNLIEDYDGKKIRMKMNSKNLEFFTSSPVYMEILRDKLDA
ncbi:diacylglycerol/lipid kinase family protein [Salegentibacter sediminis]|uniref:diacylglycerol/lipid kinase family protein n=1 Tax=Salegentibacter sediminis TaxID=1930251 RepID=UPI0009BEF454|nr:diacylglycerol kinase family protein [Salegentibacter sediminis]